MFSFDFLLWVWRGHVMLLAMLAKNKLHMMVSGRCSFVAECIGLSSTDEQNTYYIVEYDTAGWHKETARDEGMSRTERPSC